MTEIQIIEGMIALIAYVICIAIANRSIDRIVAHRNAAKARGKIVKKAINLTLFSIFLIVIFSIFGVDQSELAIFVGSALTVMGIALFAQWSILCNITSGIIIFFNHYVKLDDTVAILDKDYDIEGRISDIGLFFVILKTKEDQKISVPNSVFLNRMVKKVTPA
jgi:small-conductance mechanosensitive channel